MKDFHKVKKTYAVIFLVLNSLGCGANNTVHSLKNEINSLRDVNLQQTMELDSLQILIKKIQGRVEQLEQSSDKVFGKEVSNIKSAIDTLQKRVPPPSIVPEVALEKALASSDALPPDISGDFREALTLIRAGEFVKPQSLLEEILEVGSAQKYLPELLFWIGVAYDGQENFRQSLLVYHKIISEHPNSPLVPASLLRQSVLFERMRDVEARTTVLKNLINNFPNSPEAEEARQKLEQ